LSDVHCIHPKELYCNLATKECTGKCTNADMCSEDKWCDNPSAEPFGGDCVPDLANGEPIPTVAGNAPPLEGVCSPDAAQVVCASRACDKADNLCGYAAGTGPCNAATAQVVCRSGVCAANGACGCTADSQCGDTVSGKVCDRTNEAALNQCIDGCRSTAVDGVGSGNGCPTGLECTSSDETIGECLEPAVPKPNANGGTNEAAGCQCGSAGSGRAGQLAAFGLLATVAGYLARRRRRHLS
jgi:MYXO-CTERM domain-containing protein